MTDDSNGNRTRVTAVKGRCLNRLTMEPHERPQVALTNDMISHSVSFGKGKIVEILCFQLVKLKSRNFPDPEKPGKFLDFNFTSWRMLITFRKRLTVYISRKIQIFILQVRMPIYFQES